MLADVSAVPAPGVTGEYGSLSSDDASVSMLDTVREMNIAFSYITA